MYSDFENTNDLATPIELYEFTQGTQNWYYVSGADTVIRAGRQYLPSPIERDRVTQTDDLFRNSIRLPFPRTNDFASQYLGFAPDNVTSVTILRGHLGDPDEEFIVYWKGRVIGAKASQNKIDIECESVFTSIKRPGLRARFEQSCRHTLYLNGCNADKELYKFDSTATQITAGLNVTVTGAQSQTDGYYIGGMLITPDGASRFITAHTGSVVRLSRPLQTLEVGGAVSLFPGCDHLRETCENKFNNLDNFGGFPFIPRRNPFNGSSIV